MKKWFTRFNDADFTHYYESGEATAVQIVKNLARDIDTSNKWIDVISYKRYATNLNRNWFNWSIVELFPRITHPKYTKDVQYNKYICWHAAHNDITVHRQKNHHGEKYIVFCKLIKPDFPYYEDYHYENYQIINFGKINQKKINFIIANTTEFVSKIQQNKDPLLALLSIRA